MEWALRQIRENILEEISQEIICVQLWNKQILYYRKSLQIKITRAIDIWIYYDEKCIYLQIYITVSRLNHYFNDQVSNQFENKILIIHKEVYEPWFKLISHENNNDIYPFSDPIFCYRIWFSCCILMIL